MLLRIFSIIVFFHISNGAFTQYHHNLPTETAVWHGVETSPGGIWTTSTHPYTLFAGDTLINGENFVKCYKSNSGGNAQFMGCVKNDYNTPILVFLQNGSSVFDTIYFPDEPVMNDVFTFDPLLEFIFPFAIAEPGTSVNYSVNSVDSVLLSNGYHKRYRLFFQPLGIAHYVDGVGMTLYYESGTNISSSIDCFSINNVEILNTGQGSCSTSNFNLGLLDEKTPSVDVYYSENFIYFIAEQSFERIVEITVFNMTGQKVISNQISNFEPINFSSHKNGMYLIQIFNGKELISKKIIKTD